MTVYPEGRSGQPYRQTYAAVHGSSWIRRMAPLRPQVGHVAAAAIFLSARLVAARCFRCLSVTAGNDRDLAMLHLYFTVGTRNRSPGHNAAMLGDPMGTDGSAESLAIAPLRGVPTPCEGRPVAPRGKMLDVLVAALDEPEAVALHAQQRTTPHSSI